MRAQLRSGLALAALVGCPTSQLTAACRGDVLNDDFRFATFFPELMHPLVDKLTGALGKYMCFPKAATEAPEGAASSASTLPGSEGADAARRRCELRCVCVPPCTCDLSVAVVPNPSYTSLLSKCTCQVGIYELFALPGSEELAPWRRGWAPRKLQLCQQVPMTQLVAYLKRWRWPMPFD